MHGERQAPRPFWTTTAHSLAALSLGGCTPAPTLDVLGSFFPVWLACAALGVLVAALARLLLGRAGLGDSLPMAPLTYLGIAVAATLGTWLLWLSP